MNEPQERHGHADINAEAFRGLFDAAPYATLIVNGRGEIVIVNAQAEALFGYRRGELVGKPVEVLVPERLRAGHAAARDRFLAVPRLRPMGSGLDLFAARKGGAEFPVEISLSPLETESGLMVTATVVDLSERKREEQERLRLEVQAQQAQKRESLAFLTAGIAHDFNNLLTVILSNAGLAATLLPSDSPARPPLRDIEAAALRSAELVRQMLAYAGRGRLHVEPLSLSRVAEDVARLLKGVVPENVTFRYDLDPGLPVVYADPTQVRRVVMNLITNASEAIGDRCGVVAVRTGVMHADCEYLATSQGPAGPAEGDYAYVEVADTGCGIDAETAAMIFDPFFTTKFAGRGLGLAAVLGIVRAHKGAIKVTSEPARGATFRVLFPCPDLSAETTARREAARPD